MQKPYRNIVEVSPAASGGFVALLDCGHVAWQSSRSDFHRHATCEFCPLQWARHFAACVTCGKTDRPQNGKIGECRLCHRRRENPPGDYSKASQNRRFTMNDDIFDSWSERSAYLYGVMMSDGHISKSKSRIQVSIGERDVAWLRRLRDAFGFTGRISRHQITGQSTYCVGIVMSSKSAHRRLVSLGLKKRPPETLPDSLANHFIRGLWDGDGSVFFATHNRAYHSNLSGAWFMLDWVADKLHSLAGTKRAVLHPKSNSARSCSIAYASADTGRLADFLYSGATIWLARKRKRFFLAKQGYRQPCLT